MGEIIKENPIRTLARSRYWQILYCRSKELSNIHLFENHIDFTEIQILFLQYLEVIANLHIDLAVGEDLITEEVINDWIRAESYLLYKRKKREEEQLNRKQGNLDTGQNKQESDRIVFLHRKRVQKGNK